MRNPTARPSGHEAAAIEPWTASAASSAGAALVKTAKYSSALASTSKPPARRTALRSARRTAANIGP
jgi:hypothetical protein